MDSYCVLIVDDDQKWIDDLSDVITLYAEALTGDKSTQISIRSAKTQDAADLKLAEAPERGYDLIVIDRAYPMVDDAEIQRSLGIKWLPKVREQQPNAVITIATLPTDHEDNEQTVKAVRDDGADDFILKASDITPIIKRLVAASDHRSRLIRSRTPHLSNVLRTSAEDIHLAFGKARAHLRTLPIDNEVNDIFRDLQSSVEYISNRFQGPLSSFEKDLRSVDLQRTINEELPYFEQQLPKARIRLLVEGKKWVTTYERDVRDALREVLQNAVDSLDEVKNYSKQPVTVIVQQASSSEHVQICVSDEGPGFSDRAIQTLYQPGNSWWNRDKSRHKGMGLYVAKRMMQAVGGDINLQGPQGRGATMVLSLRDWSGK